MSAEKIRQNAVSDTAVHGRIDRRFHIHSLFPVLSYALHEDRIFGEGPAVFHQLSIVSRIDIVHRCRHFNTALFRLGKCIRQPKDFLFRRIITAIVEYEIARRQKVLNLPAVDIKIVGFYVFVIKFPVVHESPDGHVRIECALMLEEVQDALKAYGYVIFHGHVHGIFDRIELQIFYVRVVGPVHGIVEFQRVLLVCRITEQLDEHSVLVTAVYFDFTHNTSSFASRAVPPDAQEGLDEQKAGCIFGKLYLPIGLLYLLGTRNRIAVVKIVGNVGELPG